MNDDRSSIARVGEISDSESARARWYDRLLTRVGLKSRDSIRDDLEEALAEIGEENFSPQERAMLKNVLGFHRIRVDDVMVPRVDIVSVPFEATLGELLELFRTAGHSRLPVFGETLDDPKGMVHIRDFLDYIAARAEAGRPSSPERPGEKPPSLGEVDLSVTLSTARILRPVLFAPPSMPAVDLLVRMQATRTHMALVIDEYGGTDGLVSIEDLVEMVVGDIEDEHDVASGRMILREGDTFVADARASLEEVSEALGVDLAIGELAEEVDTVGGLIVTLAGRVPSRSELIAGPNQLEFEVLDADPRRVKRLRIHRRPGGAAPPRAVPRPEAPAKALAPAPATRSPAPPPETQGSRRAASRHDDGGAAGTHGRERPPGMKALASRVILASGWQRALIGFAAGTAGALAMPPFGILPALAVSLTVAVWLVDGAAAGGRFGAASTLISAGVAGWWWGFGYFVAGLWWLGAAFLVEADQFAWALPFGVLGLPARARGLFRPGFCAFASLVVPRRRAALRFRLRPDGRRMAARHSLHRLPVEHARHGARPEPLADAGGLGDRALRPDDPRHPDLRGAGDARDRRCRIAPLGGAWPRRFGACAPRRVRSLARARAPRRRPSPG